MINNIAAVISRVLAVERNSGALSSTSTVTVAGWRRLKRPLLGDENWTINLNRRLLMCPSLYRFHESWDRREGRTLNVKGEKKWNHLTRLSAMWGLKVVFFFSKDSEYHHIYTDEAHSVISRRWLECVFCQTFYSVNAATSETKWVEKGNSSFHFLWQMNV